MRTATLILACFAAYGCAGAPGAAPEEQRLAPLAVSVVPPEQTGEGRVYRVGAGDRLQLRVLQVEDLSFEEIFVDSAGQLQLPLIGSVQAAGLTPAELSTDIADRLRVRYLRDPQVAVTVLEAASAKVTIDGAVGKPGVYKLQGRTTLLQAVAMAEGTSNVANSRRVAIFRTVDGRRMVAAFDLSLIRRGEAVDPEIVGDDVVVVDTSQLSVRLREFIQAIPALGVFAYIA